MSTHDIIIQPTIDFLTLLFREDDLVMRQTMAISNTAADIIIQPTIDYLNTAVEGR